MGVLSNPIIPPNATLTIISAPRAVPLMPTVPSLTPFVERFFLIDADVLIIQTARFYRSLLLTELFETIIAATRSGTLVITPTPDALRPLVKFCSNQSR